MACSASTFPISPTIPHFQRRPDMRLEKMSSHRGPVPLSNHDMGMHLGLALIEDDIADQRDNFDLFTDLVFSGIPFSANRSTRCRRR